MPAEQTATLWVVTAYALLPAIGNLIGSLLAESLRTPRWVVGAALHGAAGIAIALVSIDLMPRILAHTPIGIIMLAFLLGAAATLLITRGVAGVRGRVEQSGARAWMVYVAIAADLVSDGLMTGAGTSVAPGLGLLLAAAQSVANVPGGFAATANLRKHEVARRYRLGMAALMFVPVVVSAVAGFVLLGTASDTGRHAALAFIVGVLLLATIEDIIPEGDAPRPPRWISTASFAAGFAALGLVSAYLD